MFERELHHIRHHWFFDLVQISAIALAVSWWRHLPVPGYAIGFVAPLAAAMSIHGDMKDWQKVIWILLIGVFLVLEFRAIRKDRTDYADAEKARRTEERKQFQRIAEGLSGAISQSQAQFSATTSRMEEAQKTMMGGDSFCYLLLTGVAFPQFQVEGKYPLHGVRVKIMEKPTGRLATPEDMLAFQLKMPLGEMPPHIGRQLFQIPRLLQLGPERDVDVVFTAFNGVWSERICLRGDPHSTQPDLATVSTIIVKSFDGKVIKRQVDANYPKDSSAACKY